MAGPRGEKADRIWAGTLDSGPATVTVPKFGVFGEPAGDFQLRLPQAGRANPCRRSAQACLRLEVPEQVKKNDLCRAR